MSELSINWKKLGFVYRRTKCHIRYVYRDGEWDGGRLEESETIPLHVAATALHYGQAAFEGLKAFRCRDGRVRIFRPEMNAARMVDTARRICMAPVDEPMFMEAVRRVIKANLEYVPPYGTGGALYIRPLLFGSGPQIGVTPAVEYTFIVMVMPVGSYYRGGLKPMRAVVYDEYDRSAPLGLGNVKVGGNYAAAMAPHELARREGIPSVLFLDAREHKYIDEFGTSNFIALTHDNKYVTPDSHSILPSVTNKCLQRLAKELGMTVERRPVEFEEIPQFATVAACGTAVVITPVNEITRGQTVYRIGPERGCLPILQKLYDRITAIQTGDGPDDHGWMKEV